MYRTITQLFRRASVGKDQCQNHNATADPITGTLTIHELFSYIAAAFTAVTLLVGLFLAYGHLKNYRVPRVQKHLIRIILTAPLFGALSLIGVVEYHSINYITPIMQLYEVFTLFSLFELFIEYIVPNATWEMQLSYFAERRQWKFFKFRYSFVMQVVPVLTILTVLAIIFNSLECKIYDTWQRVSIVVTVLGSISIGMAIAGIIPLAIFKRAQLKQADPKILRKFLAIKVIVLGQMLVNLVLNILSRTNNLKATRVLSYDDLNVGIATMATNLLATVSAIIMLLAFSPRQFTQEKRLDKTVTSDDDAASNNTDAAVTDTPLGFICGLKDVLNVSDVFVGVVRAVALRRGKFDYLEAQANKQLPEQQA